MKAKQQLRKPEYWQDVEDLGKVFHSLKPIHVTVGAHAIRHWAYTTRYATF
jgi:hypothetical protein